MSATVLKIVKAAEGRFGPFIDMADRAGMPANNREDALRSRAIAALCVQAITGCSDEVAGRAVTDGHNDGGIDAFYFDQGNDQLVFVTSEYSKDGQKGVAGAKVLAFLRDGIQRVLSDDYGGLNSKIRSFDGDIRNALQATRDITTVIAVGTTATQPLSPDAKRHVDEFISHHYGGVPELCRHEYFDQRRLYRALVPQADPVAFQIRLNDWGEVEKPLHAFYGRVSVSDVAGWWTRFGSDLYAKNIRALQSESSVNRAIEETVKNEPEHFWYFNNGLTIVCRSIKRTAKIGRVLPLNCSDISIVNGAQTVGTIGAALNLPFDAADAADVVQNAWVHVRLIEVGDDVSEFHRRITQSNNFQNAVSPRDFVGMDAVQHRLASDFALANRRYVYKSGDIPPTGDQGCDLTEAAQALACAQDSVAMAVQVKREIGALWNADKFYKLIFPQTLDSDYVWRAVLLMRAVDEKLAALRKTTDRRGNLACIHLNRVILHLVVRVLASKGFHPLHGDQEQLLTVAKNETATVFESLMIVLKIMYPDEYLGTLSKNTQQCTNIARRILDAEGPQLPDLYPVRLPFPDPRRR